MNVAFLHIPKAGGLTIEKALDLQPLRNHGRIKNRFIDKQRGHISFGHMNYPKLIRNKYVSEEFDRTAFKFAFCRNPYDRAVSHWQYVMNKHPDIIEPGTSFLDFTKHIHRDEFRIQSWWVRNVELTYIGRFENFEFHIREIGRIIGKEVNTIPTVNSTTHGPYWEYYCPESKKAVEERYEEDFMRFGYEYDPTLLHRK